MSSILGSTMYISSMNNNSKSNLVNFYPRGIISIRVSNSFKCGISIKVGYIQHLSFLSLKASLYFVIVQYQSKYWVASRYTIRSPHLKCILELNRYFVLSNKCPASYVTIYSPSYHTMYIQILRCKNGEKRSSPSPIVRCCVNIHKQHLWLGSLFVQRCHYY